MSLPAHYTVVEGIALPARLSGHAALDFCNTRAGWQGDEDRDYLEGYDHLAVWAGFVGLLPASRTASLRLRARRHATAASAVLDDAVRLRARLYEVLSDPRPGARVELVADDVHGAAARRRLRHLDGAVGWEVEVGAGLAAPLLAVAWSAGELLTSPDPSRVRACPGHGCGWLFIDRTGRRRWCTMTTCGNRAKARRFAERRRVGTVDRGDHDTPSSRRSA